MGSASLISVSVYISQLVADESEVIDETRSLGRLCEGRLSLIHFSMSLSCAASANSGCCFVEKLKRVSGVA
jgi:hypothetical protein